MEDEKRIYVKERVKGDIKEIKKDESIERVMGKINKIIEKDCMM